MFALLRFGLSLEGVFVQHRSLQRLLQLFVAVVQVLDLNMALVGAARFVTGQEPAAVPFANLQLENGVDVFAQVAAEFPGFAYSAVVSMRMFNRQQITFHGEAGVLRLTCPFNANVFDQAELTLETTAGTVVTERFTGVNQYVLQVENFCNCVQTGANYPCPLEFSRGTQKMMDMVFAAGDT